MLLPLVPSVHPSAGDAGAGLAGRQQLCQAALDRDGHRCQFCGLPAGDWQDVFHVNDDHEDWRPANLAACCPLCHGAQHIGAPAANLEMRVIWLPEMTQNGLNVLVRVIHLALRAGDIAPTLAARPILGNHELACAWRAYDALDRRAVAAASVIDTDRPRDLAAGLLSVPAAERKRLLGGLRLLHRGRRMRGGEDSYPAQLAAWAKPAGKTPDPADAAANQPAPSTP